MAYFYQHFYCKKSFVSSRHCHLLFIMDVQCGIYTILYCSLGPHIEKCGCPMEITSSVRPHFLCAAITQILFYGELSNFV